MHHTQGILEFLKTSTPEAIEAFCNARFQQNLMFFQTDYPNLFQSLQAPAKEYQLYIGQEGINIINFAQKTLMFPLVDGKSTMLEIHENCAYNPPINEKWNRIFGKTYAITSNAGSDGFCLYAKWLRNNIESVRSSDIYLLRQKRKRTF